MRTVFDRTKWKGDDFVTVNGGLHQYLQTQDAGRSAHRRRARTLGAATVHVLVVGGVGHHHLMVWSHLPVHVVMHLSGVAHFHRTRHGVSGNGLVADAKQQDQDKTEGFFHDAHYAHYLQQCKNGQLSALAAPSHRGKRATYFFRSVRNNLNSVR